MAQNQHCAQIERKNHITTAITAKALVTGRRGKRDALRPNRAATPMNPA
jgi:hypothetical protein